MANQNPEQLARDAIDRMLSAAGWVVQHKQHINLAATTGMAVWEYQTDIGPADYVLFIGKIGIVREEFAEENKFFKKITYRSDEDPKRVLSQFRNDYYPRISVTVDMIATGTDIRPLEVLLFMRDMRSKSYYEQMKGRDTNYIK